ncbi:unnamed protein product [Linum trigynum]|uniref:SAM domain-containing protein n=1 Tax=Linum trigynum TaxID=586398 RepID=A0AAV2F0Z8_9ROSI
MSSGSNPRVTITLGRSGQVVTKEGKRSPGEGSLMSSNKRCVTLFLSLVGCNLCGPLSLSITRHRGDRMKWSPSHSEEKGSRIASNDLRLKLIRKRQLKRSHDAVKYPKKVAVHPTSSRSSEAPTNYRTLPSRPSSSSHYSNLRLPTYLEQYASESGVLYSSQFLTRGSRRASTFMHLDEHVTVAGFLHSLGLGKYCISFQAEEVDMTVLKQMREKDLKDMAIPMGPRKKILLALLPPPKKRAS